MDTLDREIKEIEDVVYGESPVNDELRRKTKPDFSKTLSKA